MKIRKNIIISIIVIILLGGIVWYLLHNGSSAKSLVQKSRNNMVYILAGSYTMGPSNPDWQAGNTYPPHTVKLNGFYFSKYNVSYGDYDAYTKAVGKPKIGDPFLRKHHFFSMSKDHPVDGITWDQANDYCQWLKKKTGLSYNLPTEAQWEYVARNLGKKNWPFATNNGKQELCKNFPCEKQYKDQKGNNVGRIFAPLPVGSIPCTPMGICGLSGEVNQWMKDWYQRDYYQHSPVDNPQGPKTGVKRTVRGGSPETDSPEFDHNFKRYGVDPNKGWAGFRCVINTDTPQDKLSAYALGKQP